MKKNSLKRIMVVLLILVMVIGCFSSIAFAGVKPEYPGNYDAYNAAGEKIGTVTVSDSGLNLGLNNDPSNKNGDYQCLRFEPIESGDAGAMFIKGGDSVFLIHNGGSKYVYAGIGNSANKDFYLYPMPYVGEYSSTNIGTSDHVQSLSFKVGNYALTITDIVTDDQSELAQQHRRYILNKHEDEVMYNNTTCFCDSFITDSGNIFKLYFNVANSECVGFKADFFGKGEAEGTFELQAPEPAASTGYYITFNPSTSEATVNGFDHDAVISDCSVLIEDTQTSAAEISTTGGVSFKYEKEKYEIKFTVGGNAYTMHANCNTTDAIATMDTSDMENAIGKAVSYLEHVFRSDEPSHIITDRTVFTDGIFASTQDLSDITKRCFARIPSSKVLPSLVGLMEKSLGTELSVDAGEQYADQIDLDEDVAAMDAAIKAFENSFDAQFLTYEEGKVVKHVINDFDDITIKYATGIVTNLNNLTVVDDVSNFDLPAGQLHTFVVTVKVYGQSITRTFYLVLGYDSDAAAETAVNNILNPNPFTPDTPPVNPGEPEKDDVSKYVSFADGGNGTITVTPESCITIARIGISDSDGNYMMLKGGDFTDVTEAVSIPALKDGTNYVKVLIKSGDKTKAYTAEVKNVSGCDAPVVIKYSSAVGVYSRNVDSDYVAYVKGSYDSLAAALEAELNEQNPATVYYVKDNSVLDIWAFDNDEFDFFFVKNGSSAIKVAINLEGTFE